MSSQLSETVVRFVELTRLHGIKSGRVKTRNEKEDRILSRLFYSESGKLSQVICAEETRIGIPQFQRITEKLAKGGLVTRTPGAPHGGTFVAITQKGKDRIRNNLMQQKQEFDHLINLFISPKEARVTSDTLHKLNKWLTEELK